MGAKQKALEERTIDHKKVSAEAKTVENYLLKIKGGCDFIWITLKCVIQAVQQRRLLWRPQKKSCLQHLHTRQPRPKKRRQPLGHVQTNAMGWRKCQWQAYPRGLCGAA